MEGQVREQTRPDGVLTFDARARLGRSLLGQQKYAEAEPLLVQGYEGMKRRAATIPPQGRHRLTQTLEALVRLYEATGAKEKAAAHRRQLEEAAEAKGAGKPKP